MSRFADPLGPVKRLLGKPLEWAGRRIFGESFGKVGIDHANISNAEIDAMIYGTSFELDGERIDPRTVRLVDPDLRQDLQRETEGLLLFGECDCPEGRKVCHYSGFCPRRDTSGVGWPD